MEGDAAHHLGRVLRAQAGQLYELSDGQKVWLGRISSIERDRVEFALVEELPAYRPAVDVTLLLAVVKFDAFEWAIEKATELGVSAIVPLSAARSEKGRALEEDSRRGIAAVAESERAFSANHDAPGTMFCAAQGRSEASAVREARCPADARTLTGPESIKGSDSNRSGRRLDG